MGLETPSVGPQIAECQRVLEQSGLEYKVSPSPIQSLRPKADGWVDAVSPSSRYELARVGSGD